MTWFYRLTNYFLKSMNFPILLVLLLFVIGLACLWALSIFALGYREGEDMQREKAFNSQNKPETKGERDMLKWGKDIRGLNKPAQGGTLEEKDPSIQIPVNGIRKVILNRKGWQPLMLSDFGFQVLQERGCFNDKICMPCLLKRDDPRLISAFEEYGKELTGDMASLRIIEIPAEVEWELVERDGLESIEEVHRVWR